MSISDKKLKLDRLNYSDTLNPWHLRKCPYFEQDPEMTYEKFLHDYKEIIRYEAEPDMHVKKANDW